MFKQVNLQSIRKMVNGFSNYEMPQNKFYQIMLGLIIIQ